MKAKPTRLEVMDGKAVYHACEPGDATHVWINMPEETGFGYHCLPVVLSGSRDRASRERGVPCWSWNGDTVRPTLKPSIWSSHGKGRDTIHVWLTDGNITVLEDSTRCGGRIMPLDEVDI